MHWKIFVVKFCETDSDVCENNSRKIRLKNNFFYIFESQQKI